MEKQICQPLFFESKCSWFAFGFGFGFGLVRINGNDRLNLNLYNVLLEPVSDMMQFNGSHRASFLRLQNRCGFFYKFYF